MKTAEDRIRELAGEVSGSHGFDLEEVRLIGQGRKSILRITIDKPGGVTLDDCAIMSRDLEALLDLEDPIRSSYTLEVSSPGLERPLKNPADYKRFEGRLARVVLKEKANKKNFLIGRIKSSDANSIILETDGKEVRIGFENISRARLEIEI